jgi:hypothetical protein
MNTITTQGGKSEKSHEMKNTGFSKPELPSGRQTHLRNVAHIAASQLQDQGYTVIKAVTRSWPYDLIAFNQHQILLIATRRHTKPQNAKQIVQIHKDLISDMQYIPAPACTEKQIWIYQNGYGFSMYKLFKSGIMKKEWG